jgi:hypothetical protein
MILRSACVHLRLCRLLKPLGNHFLPRGHRHGMTGRGVHDRVIPNRAFAMVRPHVHTRGHGHGSVLIACCSRGVTVGKRLVRGTRKVASPSRNGGRNQQERQQCRQRACNPTHPIIVRRSQIFSISIFRRQPLGKYGGPDRLPAQKSRPEPSANPGTEQNHRSIPDRDKR